MPESNAHRRWRRCRRTSRRQRSARPTLAGRQCGVRGRGGRCLASSKDAPAIAPVDSARWRNASRPGLIARPRRSHPVRLLPNRVATKTRTQPDSWRIRAALASHPTHRRPVHVTPGARRSHGDGFAPKTVHEVHVIIRSALNDAIDCGLLRNNAAAKARSPRPHDRRRTGTSAWDVSSRGDRSGCGSGHDRSPRAVTTKAASTAARSSASATTSPSWPTRARTARVKSSGPRTGDRGWSVSGHSAFLSDHPRWAAFGEARKRRGPVACTSPAPVPASHRSGDVGRAEPSEAAPGAPQPWSRSRPPV